MDLERIFLGGSDEWLSVVESTSARVYIEKREVLSGHRDACVPGDGVSCLSVSSSDPVLTCSCWRCCSLKRKTTTVNKFSGISFYLVCWGISVGGKGRCPPGKQSRRLNGRGWKLINIAPKNLSLLYQFCVYYISTHPLFWWPYFVFSLTSLHPHSPDFDPPGAALAAGIDSSRPQPRVILTPSSRAFSCWGRYSPPSIWHWTAPSPLSVINIAGFASRG